MVKANLNENLIEELKIKIPKNSELVIPLSDSAEMC